MSMANLDILLRNQMVNLNILIQILNVSNRTKKCESYEEKNFTLSLVTIPSPLLPVNPLIHSLRPSSSNGTM